MDAQQEHALRDAARAWLDALDRLEELLDDPDATSEVVDAGDAAALARLRFHSVLVGLGWTPPGGVASGHA